MAVADLLAGLPGAISENIARDTKTASEFQDAKIKERDWRRQRETQFILSKYSNERGELTPEGAQAAMQHAARADLLPEVQKAIEERTTTALQSQIDAHQKRMLLKEMGVNPSLVSLPSSSTPERVEAPQEAPDTTGFTTPDMMPAARPGRPDLREGEVRVPGAPEAMPEPTQATFKAPQGTYWSDAMREQPRDVSSGAAGAGADDFEAGGAKYVSLKGKSPAAVAAVRLQVEQNLGAAPGASIEEIEASYNKLRKALYSPAVAGQMPLMAFLDPKTGKIDLGAYEKHKADIRTKSAEAESKLAQAPAEQVKQRRGEMLEEQAAGIALTGAKNTAAEKNTEREAIGGMVSTANAVAGINLDPSKFSGEGAMKEARDVTGRVIQNKKAQNLLAQPDFLAGDWNKVITEVQTIKAAVQASDKIPGTESGEMALIGMMAPNLNPAEMKRLGMLHDGGLTEKGWDFLARALTKIPQDEVKHNLMRMLQHSTGLAADVAKYSAPKGQGGNYAYTTPKAADATFSTGAALAGGNPVTPEPKEPTDAEVRAMKPAEAKAAKEAKFKREKAAKAAAKGPKTVTSQAQYDALPAGTIYLDASGNKHKKGGK